MRKADLIAKLEAIEGNPEVLIWNGLVDDWMKIGEVSKEPLFSYKNGHKDWKPQGCRTDESVKRLCRKKTVILIDPAPKGSKVFDRNGSIEY